MSSQGRPELLILNRIQFGYHYDTYYYAKFAAQQLRITYMGFDAGDPIRDVEGVQVKYINRTGPRCLRYLRLVSAFARGIRNWGGVVFLRYFPGCSLLRCWGPRDRMIVDIRTGSINRNAFLRWCADRLMRWESCRFRSISVISRSLAERLHLPQDRTHILPLGAEHIAVGAKRFDRLDLLYVGTFDGRRLEDTVLGLERFRSELGAGVALTYTIVGDGHGGELEELRRVVRAKGLDHIVRLPGYVHRTELQDVFKHCNVGISYVPISDIYDCQPVTKTFEYIYAGMPVIATRTKEHERVIEPLNGVLIEDTPEDFCRGLKEIYGRRDEFQSATIQRCCPESSWDHIVDLNFVPYIRSIGQS